MTLHASSARAIVGVGSWPFLAMPAGAQIGKLVDPNTRPRASCRQLPNMTPGHREGHESSTGHTRPWSDLNKVLAGTKAHARPSEGVLPQGVRADQREHRPPRQISFDPRCRRRACPAEFEEYRPWKTWTQFDKKSASNVGQRRYQTG